MIDVFQCSVVAASYRSVSGSAAGFCPGAPCARTSRLRRDGCLVRAAADESLDSPRKHPRMTWKQMRRRYFAADIAEGRYRFRRAQISKPYDVDEVDPCGAHFRRSSHDGVAFVGQVSEYLA
ncbi:hypothetical protein ACIQGO_26390 [Streptomyces shenzhenensis]|uniref:hypothetical protein n=1 Tax=Streptomyces shenzhenensis TaxID=943815 RepID=UPI003806714D